MPAECDRIAARFPPRELRGDRGLSVAAVASVVPLLEKYLLRWVGCFINSTSDFDQDTANLETIPQDNALISLRFLLSILSCKKIVKKKKEKKVCLFFLNLCKRNIIHVN